MKTTIKLNADKSGTITLDCTAHEFAAMAVMLDFAPIMDTARSYVKHLGGDPSQMLPVSLAMKEAGFTMDPRLCIDFGRNVLHNPVMELLAMMDATGALGHEKKSTDEPGVDVPIRREITPPPPSTD